MADNIFQGLVSTPSLFSGISEDRPIPIPPEDGVRTARLAALVDEDLTRPDIFTAMEERTQAYTDLIEKYGDTQIRREQAVEDQKNDINGALKALQDSPTIDPTGELGRQAATAAQAAINESIERREQYALEKRAIERVQDLAATDATQAKVMLNVMEHGSAANVIRDINTKRLIIGREIERAQIAKEEQNFFFDVVDFFASIVPFDRSMSRVGNVDVPEGLKGFWDNILPGRREKTESSVLWNMPAADFATYVRDHLIPNIKENSDWGPYENKQQALELWTELGERTPSVLETNAWSALDNFGWIPVTKIGKAAISVPVLMVRNGARKQAASVLGRAIDNLVAEGTEVGAKKSGMTAEEVANASLPNAVNPNPTVVMPLGTDVASIRERAERLLRSVVPQLQQPGRFVNNTELMASVAKEEERLASELGRELKNVRVNTNELSDGSRTRSITFDIGKKDGGGYASERSAKTGATTLGFKDASRIVKDESGQYFIQLEKDIPETAHYTSMLEPRVSNVLSRFVLNSRLIGDSFLSDIGQLSGNNRQLLLKTIQKLGKDLNKGLGPVERENVAQLLAKSNNNSRWFNENEINSIFNSAYGRDVSEAELRAYRTAVDINDIEYVLRNDEKFKTALVKGFQTVEFDTGKGPFAGNALIDRELKIPPHQSAYNIADGIHYGKFNDLTEAELGRLREQGYILISAEQGIKLNDGYTVKHFLVKPKDINIKPLERFQVAYRPGGHRFYRDKWFAKQAVRRKQPDGAEFFDNPNTYIAGTKAEVDFWTRKMEDARLLFLENEGKMTDEDLAALVDDVFDEHPGLPKGTEFVQNMKDDVFSKNSPFRTLYDREMPPEYIEATATPNYGDIVDDGWDSWLKTTGRMYYSRRGEQLTDYMGNLAPTLDAFEALDKSLMNIANITSFSDYKITSVERWVETFKGVITGYDPGASAYSTFSNATFKKGAAEAPSMQKKIQQAEAQREIIRRNIGWKTETVKAQEGLTRSLINWVNGSNPKSVRNDIARSMTNWVLEKNPVSFLRGAAFDMKLGLFNVAQFPLQMQTMAAATMLSPKLGMQGMFAGLPTRLYLMKGAGEPLLDQYVKQGIHTLAGFKDVGEFKAYMRSTKDNGFFKMGGTHQMVNDYGPGVAYGEWASNVNGLRERARFFFYEGELANRLVAWRIAWGETRDRFPSLKVGSEEFNRRLAGRAEEYAFNMSEQSGAWWQKGVLSIPTQFWSYSARMAEAMFGSHFTRQQRAQLLLGQSLMYGSAGVPLANLLSDKLKENNMEGAHPDNIWGALDRGLLDTAVYNLLGQDVMIGDRFGSGNLWGDQIRDIMGWSQFGEKSAAEIFIGATGNIIGSTAVDLVPVLQYMTAESGDTTQEMKEEAWIKLGSNISTFSNAFKTYLVVQHGMIKSGNGTVVVDNVPSSQAWATMLGIQPGQQDDVSAWMAYIKDKNKAVDEAAKVIRNYRVEMLNRPDKTTELADQINVFTRLLPEDVRKEAIKRAHGNIDPSLYAGLAKRMEREKQQKELIEEMSK